MPTEADYAGFFKGYNPSGGGVEEWNMWCQAFVHRAAAAGQGVQGSLRVYNTAREARLCSGWLNADLSSAPLGAVGWWYWEPDDHVAFWLGHGFWFMGSRHVDYQVGGFSRNAGTIDHNNFLRKSGLTFLGWSETDGGNKVLLNEAPPPAPVAIGRTQRRVNPDQGVNVRNSPSTEATSLVIASFAANAVVNVGGFVTNGGLANGTRVWYELATGGWMNAASFTEIHGHDIPDKTR
ncbi:MAG: hypothetical protein ACOH10_06825 [Rhodoglobus sp.]